MLKQIMRASWIHNPQATHKAPVKNAIKGKVLNNGEQVWYIDINTLKELDELYEEVIDRIIYEGNCITIYDDYIE